MKHIIQKANAKEWFACKGKQTYETWKIANRARKRRQRAINKRKIKKILRVYECDFCKKFHLTHRLNWVLNGSNSNGRISD